tara:strand:+ start:366 stop:518 length:153 start_codon:yes stop_codon:yes gene_type:complete
MDTIAQIFGMTFIGIITVCLITSILKVIFSSESRDRNKKLLNNMKNFDKK